MDTTLYLKEGNSDKQYRVWIDGKTVRISYGRRGGTQQLGIKGKNLSQPEAEKLVRSVIAEKVAKGYKPGKDAPAIEIPKAKPAPAGRKAETAVQFIRPMLLNPIDSADAFLNDPAWYAQPKFDGIRLQLHRSEGQVAGLSRTGKQVALPSIIADAARTLVTPDNAANDFILDGELIGDKLFVFDVLRCGSRDLRGQAYGYRLGFLTTIMESQPAASVCTTIQMTVTAMSAEEKRVMHSRLKDTGGEGIVFKRKDKPYTSDRPNTGGDALKLKFVATASVIVQKVNAKRSVDMQLADGTRVGSVTIPPNKDIPKVGDIIEVRYLYAYRDGSLIQAVYLGVREDVDRKDCTAKQLQYKGEAREENKPAETAAPAKPVAVIQHATPKAEPAPQAPMASSETPAEWAGLSVRQIAARKAWITMRAKKVGAAA